jgi:two-component system, cell cycle sensor histidine kinase and response regulator CckA
MGRVVDDDPMVRDLIARTITGAGFRVLTAGDGEEALAVAGTLDGQLGLVVTDIQMPRMDGIALADHLASSNPRLPVLFISGYAPQAQGAALPGPVLPKPFTHDGLLLLVHQMLDATDGARAST